MSKTTPSQIYHACKLSAYLYVPWLIKVGHASKMACDQVFNCHVCTRLYCIVSRTEDRCCSRGRPAGEAQIIDKNLNGDHSKLRFYVWHERMEMFFVMENGRKFLETDDGLQF